MICEPIALVRDNDGEFHFAPDEGLPLKTIVDSHNLPFGQWMKIHRHSIIIELDGRTVIYDRIAVTPEGHWICRLRIDPNAVYGHVEQS